MNLSLSTVCCLSRLVLIHNTSLLVSHQPRLTGRLTNYAVEAFSRLLGSSASALLLKCVGWDRDICMHHAAADGGAASFGSSRTPLPHPWGIKGVALIRLENSRSINEPVHVYECCSSPRRCFPKDGMRHEARYF